MAATGKRIVIDPVTRIEGHLRVVTHMNNDIVASAKCSGDMYRGLEKALIGHDARVAQQVTQRGCGVCPYAHAETAALALESAMGISPNPNGQLVRNLIIGAYQIKDFMLHFYTLCALDFIDITAVLNYKGKDGGLVQVKQWVQKELASNKVFPAAPFLPRYEADYCTDQEVNISAIRGYLDVIPVMANVHKMVSIFGGKSPHPVAIEAGGVTTLPSIDKLARYHTLLQQCTNFVRHRYLPDVIAVAKQFPRYFREGKGYGNLLGYPYYPDQTGAKFAFPGGVVLGGTYQELDLTQITEDHTYSYYQPNGGKSALRPLETAALHPLKQADFNREQQAENGKYSWIRAPRYRGEALEVGPSARLVTTYLSKKNPEFTAIIDRYNQQLGLTIDDYVSVMGRHLSRAILADYHLTLIERDLAMITPDASAFDHHPIPRNARGFGLTEATRGALGHWIETDDQGLIRNYEMVVPTTWNMSPRDQDGKPGPVEKMLEGTRVAKADHPMELARIVRSTDPCIGCSVH